MALLDLLELGELFLSWRLYVGMAVTVALCAVAFSLIPSGAPGWVAWSVCTPIGVAGVILSFAWQVRSDSSN